MKPKIKKDTLFLVGDVETLHNLAGDRPLVWEIGLALIRGDGLFMGSWGSVINVSDMILRGFNMGYSTLSWLTGQEEAVRKRFQEACDPKAKNLPAVITQMYEWIERTTGTPIGEFPNRDLYFLGRGAAFDCPIVEVLCSEANIGPMPWNFWNGACIRTFEMIFPTQAPKRGIAHRAEDDAIWEAQCLAKQLQVYWQFAKQINELCGSIDRGDKEEPQNVESSSEKIAIGEQIHERVMQKTKETHPFSASYGIARPIGGDPYEGFAYGDTAVCLHQSCPDCQGTFRKKDGSACVHALACPCPKCSPTC